MEICIHARAVRLDLTTAYRPVFDFSGKRPDEYFSHKSGGTCLNTVTQLDNFATPREILFYEEHVADFLSRQTQRVRLKILWTLQLIQELDRIPAKFFKHLKGTSLYEIRIASGSNSYRIFCFFDQGDIIVLLHGIAKKTRRTPKKEIDRALRLQQAYWDEQNK